MVKPHITELFPLVLAVLNHLIYESHGLQHVTCGSVIKLQNTYHRVRLHSHDVKYGSGSGQQSVTGTDQKEDVNSHWAIRGPTNKKNCMRGEPVKCGQEIRLQHQTTLRNLHSHHFGSPLSNSQEVSAFGEDGEGDTGDVWKVVCEGDFWRRDDIVMFKHSDTGVFLVSLDVHLADQLTDKWKLLEYLCLIQRQNGKQPREYLFIRQISIPNDKQITMTSSKMHTYLSKD